MADQHNQIFLSYSREDVAFARELRDWLLEQVHQPWMDLFDIPAGARWPDAIDQALRASEVIVGILSPASLASENVKNEWDWAIARQKRLILLMVEPCELPFHYVSINYLDFVDSGDAGYASLAAALSDDERPEHLEPDTVVDEPAVMHSERQAGPDTAPARSSRLRQALNRQTPVPVLIGREDEQQRLSHMLESAKTGQGGLALLGGQAGVGKTTLVNWLQNIARENSIRALAGGCYDLSTTPPYGPWFEILRAYEPGDELPQIPPGVRSGAGPSSVSSQEELFEIVGEFFAELSDHQPLLLILEDLHWADIASLEFLRFFARYLSGLPILIVATYRDDELTRRHALFEFMPLFTRESGAESLLIRPLDDAALTQLIAARYVFPTEHSARLVGYLSRHAQGNPFFALELLQSLEAEGVLVQEEGGDWAFGNPAALQLPPLIRQVIERRLHRLSGATLTSLEIAAIIGHEFDFELWSMVTTGEEQALIDTLEEGIDYGVLDETDSAGSYAFRHALFREALYERQIWPRRRARHRRVAEALEERANVAPDIIAHHYEQADDERAAEWLVRAADRAIERWAWIQAVAYASKAVQRLEQATGSERQRALLLDRIGNLLFLQDAERAQAHYEEALAIAERIGDARFAHSMRYRIGACRRWLGEFRAGHAEMLASLQALREMNGDLPESPSFGPSLIGLAGSLVLVGDLEQAKEVIDLGGDLSQGHYGYSLAARGGIEAIRGCPDRASALFDKAHAIARTLDNRTALLQTTGWESRFIAVPYATDDLERRDRLYHSMMHYRSVVGLGVVPDDTVQRAIDVLVGGLSPIWGNWSVLREHFERAERLNNVSWAQYIMSELGEIAYWQGDLDIAWLQVPNVLPDGPDTEPGNCNFVAALRLQRLAAQMLLQAGESGQAHGWLDAHDRWLGWNGSVLGRAEGKVLWARYHQQRGDLNAAREQAEEALEHASDPRQPLALIAAHRFLGQLDVVERRLDEAVDHLDASLDLAEQCETPFECALTLLEIARLRTAAGDKGDAQRLLDEVKAICEPLEAQPTLDRVAELEAELAASNG